jgi:hypothetical protein
MPAPQTTATASPSSVPAEQPEGVVVDRRALEPGRALERGGERLAVGRDVDAAEVEDAARGRRIEPSLRDELPEEVHCRLDTGEVHVVPGPADAGDEVAVQARREELRLRVAAVDAENDLHAGRGY